MQDAAAIVAQHLAQVPDSLVGFIHQNQRIPVCGKTCRSGAVVVKLIHRRIIAACKPSAPASAYAAPGGSDDERSRADNTNWFRRTSPDFGSVLLGLPRGLRPRIDRLAAIGRR